MGGFINPLVVASGAMWKVGQLRLAQKLRFVKLTIDEAIEQRRLLERLMSVESLEGEDGFASRQ